MILGALLGLWLAMWAAGETPIGRVLRRWLIDRPAARLARISRGHVMLMLIVAGIALALIWLLENDGRMLVAMGLPAVISFAVAIDLASLLDIAAVAVIAASTVRVRTIATWLRRRPAPRRPRAGGVRVRRERPLANDDEGRPALAA
jgi:membrane protein implicated in regulation of membrane protease activity